jgi:hypothetical protein
MAEQLNPLRLRGGGAPDLIWGDGGGVPQATSSHVASPLHHARVVPLPVNGEDL